MPQRHYGLYDVPAYVEKISFASQHNCLIKNDFGLRVYSFLAKHGIQHHPFFSHTPDVTASSAKNLSESEIVAGGSFMENVLFFTENDESRRVRYWHLQNGTTTGVMNDVLILNRSGDYTSFEIKDEMTLDEIITQARSLTDKESKLLVYINSCRKYCDDDDLYINREYGDDDNSQPSEIEGIGPDIGDEFDEEFSTWFDEELLALNE